VARKELGEILLEADLITQSQLTEGLGLQRTYGERLASVLVRQHILTEKFAVTYLGRQLGVPAVDLSRHEIDLDLLDLIPLELCERKLVFPVKIEGTRLQLAMSDPLDKPLVAEIEFKTGVRLAPMIALDASIKNAIIEARRAHKAGVKKINPNVQRARDGEKAHRGDTIPLAPDDASPIPLSRLERENAILESLGGTPIRALHSDPDDQRERKILQSLDEPHPLKVPSPPPSEATPGSAASGTPASQAPAPPAAARPPAAAPAAEAHPPTPVAAPVPAARPINLGPTVLAVDDDPAILRVIELVLQQRKLNVVTALTGREGLQRVKEQAPDLIVLDGMLPDVHGFEICRQLKHSELFRHIPVILVSAVHTGWRFAADVKETYGADDYLEKPFEPSELARRVEVALHRAPASGSSVTESAARAHLKEGVVSLKQAHIDEALEHFQRGLAVDQFNDLLHYYTALAYEKKDMAFHAIDHYEKAIAINPEFYDAITALANLYQRQEFWRKAVEMWEMALQATRDDGVKERIKAHLMTLL
jgi:DNA-binding response OmpR family regulator